MLYTQKLTAQVFLTFLERLMQERTRKLMWIVDRHPVHRSDAVHQWLQEHRDKIELHLLPPYSPQLNPAEYLNCDCLARRALETSHPQLGSVKRAASLTSIQTAKVTDSNCQVFPASIHCLCCLNNCSVNYCRVNKRMLDNRGESGEPCGVPHSVSSTVLPTNTPARNDPLISKELYQSLFEPRGTSKHRG